MVPPRQGIPNPAFTLSEGAPSPSRSSIIHRTAPPEASPEVPPRETVSSSSLAPPRPPKCTPAPPIPTRATVASQSAPAAPSQSGEPSLDENIARLMELGYSYDDVNRALAIAQNNSSVAVQILQSFVPPCT